MTAGREQTPFDGSGIEWHAGLPSPYTYQASDFSMLVAAVHEYECVAASVPALVEAGKELRSCIWHVDLRTDEQADLSRGWDDALARYEQSLGNGEKP